jgi:CheY-like chemotaxis protein
MPHVLLVEPDLALADEVRRAFGPAGFDVTALSAGEEAVQRCRDVVPDLILLSAELPDMSGFSVCNRLKRALANVPLILLTREATDAAIEAHRATRTRADDYVRKPVDLADLLGRAATLLQDAGSPAAGDPEAETVAPRAPGQPPPSASALASPPSRPPALFPSGRAVKTAPPNDGPPPVLQRADSSAVAKLGLAAAMAAAAAPPPATSAPPRPPPTPVAAAKGSGAPLARVKVSAPPRPETADPFADPPRDPAPPKGTPEEKLEFFRDRLRARDQFVARAREAWVALKAETAQVRGDADVLRSELETARDHAEELERRAGEASQDAAARDARVAELEAQLARSEDTRQSLSDVLS